MSQASDFLHSWNSDNAPRLSGLRVEDDIRDAMQSVRVKHPTLQQRQDLLVLSDLLGVQYSFLGFPGSGARESQLCSSLAQFIHKRDLLIRPVFMSRAAVESDMLSVIEIQQGLPEPAIVDIFFSTSALRHKVEEWTVRELIEAARPVASLARANGIELHVSLEDSTRTAPSDLAMAIEAAIEFDASSVFICDTVGDCTPSGAVAITRFAVDIIGRAGSTIEVGWHGHNDRGQSTANALGAVNAGASIISGTFMGIGERTGNIPLEQIILMSHEAGGKSFSLHHLDPLCDLLCTSFGIDMDPTLPILGPHAFSTSTGTHISALLKARKYGPDFEDLMFSSVNASLLGRKQKFLLGPNAGRSAVAAALNAIAVSPTDSLVNSLLDYCKTQKNTFNLSEQLAEHLRGSNE